MLVLCVLILLSLEDDPTIISEASSVKPAPAELLCVYVCVYIYICTCLCLLFLNIRHVDPVTSELMHCSPQSLSLGVCPSDWSSQQTFDSACSSGQ